MDDGEGTEMIEGVFLSLIANLHRPLFSKRIPLWWWWGWFDEKRGLSRRICRVLISRSHGKSGSAAAATAQDVKRNYTGRQIYCGQPEKVGRTCWRMSRRWWHRRVCSHSRSGYRPLNNGQRA